MRHLWQKLKLKAKNLKEIKRQKSKTRDYPILILNFRLLLNFKL